MALNAQGNHDINQNFVATTLEEYNYITKGYPYQLKMGLTVTKAGYSIKHIYTYLAPDDLSKVKNLTIDYIGLYREGTTIPCGIIAVANKTSPSPQYLCIPHPHTSGEVKLLARQAVLALPEPRLRLYYFGLQDLYTNSKLQDFLIQQEK